MDDNQECCATFTSTLKDGCAYVFYQVKYLGTSIVKILPSVVFRLLCFWLILSYSSEFYLNKKGNGPGRGIFLPFALVALIIGINFAIGYWKLNLKMEELIVNSFGNLILPVYVHLFYLVSLQFNL